MDKTRYFCISTHMFKNSCLYTAIWRQIMFDREKWRIFFDYSFGISFLSVSRLRIGRLVCHLEGTKAERRKCMVFYGPSRFKMVAVRWDFSQSRATRFTVHRTSSYFVCWHLNKLSYQQSFVIMLNLTVHNMCSSECP